MTCCARADERRRPPGRYLAAAVALALLQAAPGLGRDAGCGPGKRGSVEELTNPFLGPEYARWLIGAIGCLAAEEDVARYLTLQNDGEAERFVASFWQERPGVRETYEERAVEADKRYSEAAFAGRRTDRGMVFIIYGPPEKILFEEFHDVDDPVVERWTYPKKGLPGLDGRKPLKAYRFHKTGDLTTFYRPLPNNDPRRRLNRRPAGFEPPP